MNGFKCNVTGATSTVPLAKPKVPRRCGADPPNRVMNPTPGNCTYGAKSPFYWFQKERNNVGLPRISHEPRPHSNCSYQMNEGTYSPPSYTDLYNFRDGPQDDIFQNSYDSIPAPSPNQTTIPKLKVSPANTGVPFLPSSAISSIVTPPVVSPSTSPCGLPSSPTPSSVYPTPSPFSSSPPVPSIPLVTVTNTVFVTVFTSDPLPTFTSLSSSTATPIPYPSSNPADPGVIVLGRRKPM